MGLFSTLIQTIFSHSKSTSAAPASAPAAAPAASTPAPAAAAPMAASAPAASTAAPAGATPLQNVDVGAVMDGLAAKNPEKLDWKNSIVDLMKLVGMDSSLSARKALAKELNYTGDESDSATMNVWLHKEVLSKIAQNGGKLPAGL